MVRYTSIAGADRLHLFTFTSPLLQLPNTFRVFYGAFVGLHKIQQQAIEPVLANRDLILQSATGSGKTEAVLAPCLERIIASDRNHAALYIAPTRALAFDIRRRFAGVLKERLGVRLAIRTGDMKTGGGGRPDIILTAPESLDVILGSAHNDLQAFLLRVRTIIIDEVDPFVHQYRGRQLAYLMQRLERRIGQTLQKIALSATIAEPIDVCRFLHFKSDFVLLTENVRRRIMPTGFLFLNLYFSNIHAGRTKTTFPHSSLRKKINDATTPC